MKFQSIQNPSQYVVQVLIFICHLHPYFHLLLEQTTCLSTVFQICYDMIWNGPNRNIRNFGSPTLNLLPTFESGKVTINDLPKQYAAANGKLCSIKNSAANNLAKRTFFINISTGRRHILVKVFLTCENIFVDIILSILDNTDFGSILIINSNIFSLFRFLYKSMSIWSCFFIKYFLFFVVCGSRIQSLRDTTNTSWSFQWQKDFSSSMKHRTWLLRKNGRLFRLFWNWAG